MIEEKAAYPLGSDCRGFSMSPINIRCNTSFGRSLSLFPTAEPFPVAEPVEATARSHLPLPLAESVVRQTHQPPETESSRASKYSENSPETHAKCTSALSADPDEYALEWIVRRFSRAKWVSLLVINMFSSPLEGVLHNTTTNIWF